MLFQKFHHITSFFWFELETLLSFLFFYLQLFFLEFKLHLSQLQFFLLHLHSLQKLLLKKFQRWYLRWSSALISCDHLQIRPSWVIRVSYRNMENFLMKHTYAKFLRLRLFENLIIIVNVYTIWSSCISNRVIGFRWTLCESVRRSLQKH